MSKVSHLKTGDLLIVKDTRKTKWPWGVYQFTEENKIKLTITEKVAGEIFLLISSHEIKLEDELYQEGKNQLEWFHFGLFENGTFGLVYAYAFENGLAPD